MGGQSSSFGRYSQSRISPVGSIGSYTRLRDSSQCPTVHVISGGSGRGVPAAAAAANSTTSLGDNVAAMAAASARMMRSSGLPSTTSSEVASTLLPKSKSASNVQSTALNKRVGNGGDLQPNSIIEEDADEQSEMKYEANAEGQGLTKGRGLMEGMVDGKRSLDHKQEVKTEQGMTKNEGKLMTDGFEATAADVAEASSTVKLIC